MLLFSFVTTHTHNCKDQVHIGPPEDGGWEVCLERRFDIKPSCLVYSFGCVVVYKGFYLCIRTIPPIDGVSVVPILDTHDTPRY